MADQTQKFEQMNPLADPTTLAQKLGTDENDASMMLALDLASARFRGQTRNPISLTSETVTLDAHGTRSLLLPFMHVVSVDSLTINGVAYDSTDFEWSESGMIRLNTIMPDLWRSVQIACTYGYKQIPQDVQEAVLDLATSMYPMLQSNAYTSYTTGTESRSFNQQLQVGYSAQWSSCVNRYKVVGAW